MGLMYGLFGSFAGLGFMICVSQRPGTGAGRGFFAAAFGRLFLLLSVGL